VLCGDESLQSRVVEERQHKFALLLVFFGNTGLLAEAAPNSVPGDLNPRITHRKWEEILLLHGTMDGLHSPPTPGLGLQFLSAADAPSATPSNL